MQVYFKDQCHESLCDFLQFRNIHDRFGGTFIQVHVFFKPVMFTWLNGWTIYSIGKRNLYLGKIFLMT